MNFISDHYTQLEAINRWCGPSLSPVHPIDLLFPVAKFNSVEQKIWLVETQSAPWLFYVNSPVSSSQMKAIVITFF